MSASEINTEGLAAGDLFFVISASLSGVLSSTFTTLEEVLDELGGESELITGRMSVICDFSGWL